SILLLVVVMVILVVIVVAIVGVVIVVAIIGVVIVVAIIGVVVEIMIIVEITIIGIVVVVRIIWIVVVVSGVPSIIKFFPLMKASMSFSVFGTMFGHKTANSWNLLTPGDLIGLFYSNRLGICIPPGQGIIDQVPFCPVFLSVLAIVAACASRAAATPSAISCRMAA
ncbi:hypothetical protein Tco_0404299, partial [Tanacetum coccineum]